MRRVGSGQHARYSAEELLQFGAKPVTRPDSNGAVCDPDGITAKKRAWVMERKDIRRGWIAEYAQKFGAQFLEGCSSWRVLCQCAFPSAMQNEVTGEAARELLNNGGIIVAEGANMPSMLETVKLFALRKILYAPAKAANAGGVATAGLEMSQNSMRMAWTRDEVDARLHQIMSRIHDACVKAAAKYGQPGNCVMGANIAGFTRVADAMLDQGLV